MRLDQTHARYWARRKAPDWARVLVERDSAHRDVLACVNAHVGPHKRKACEHDASNLISLLRLVRRNQARGAILRGGPRDLVEYLAYLSVSGDSDRRRRLAYRWLRRWYKATHGIRI